MILGGGVVGVGGPTAKGGQAVQAGGSLPELTAAVRSTSFLLLRIKQASPLSILQNTSC